jgi:hypothetical protein
MIARRLAFAGAGTRRPIQRALVRARPADGRGAKWKKEKSRGRHEMAVLSRKRQMIAPGS